MTYTEKILAEFDERMVRLNRAKITRGISDRHIFQWNDEEIPSHGDQYEDSEYGYLDQMLRTLFSDLIAQALAEERARVVGVIGRMEKKNTERHTEGCRGFKNQIYFAGDSLGGSCTCAPILDRDYTQYNQALNDLLSSLDKPNKYI